MLDSPRQLVRISNGLSCRGDVALESNADGLAPLKLLLVVLVCGVVLLFAWSELRGKLVMREAAGKRPRPLKPRTVADCPLCQVELGAAKDGGSAAALPRL